MALSLGDDTEMRTFAQSSRIRDEPSWGPLPPFDPDNPQFLKELANFFNDLYLERNIRSRYHHIIKIRTNTFRGSRVDTILYWPLYNSQPDGDQCEIRIVSSRWSGMSVNVMVFLEGDGMDILLEGLMYPRTITFSIYGIPKSSYQNLDPLGIPYKTIFKFQPKDEDFETFMTRNQGRVGVFLTKIYFSWDYNDDPQEGTGMLGEYIELFRGKHGETKHRFLYQTV